MKQRLRPRRALGSFVGVLAGVFAALPAAVAADEPLRVAFIYVDPVGDTGWSFQDDLARRELERVLGVKVQATYQGNVARPRGRGAGDSSTRGRGQPAHSHHVVRLHGAHLARGEAVSEGAFRACDRL